jgi:hypothetical protein
MRAAHSKNAVNRGVTRVVKIVLTKVMKKKWQTLSSPSPSGAAAP